MGEFFCNQRGPYNGNRYVGEELRFPLKKEWTIKSPKGGFASRAIGFDGLIYALVGLKKGLVAIDVSTGNYAWQNLDGYRRSGFGYVWGLFPHNLLVQCFDRKGYYLECIDAKTGKTKDKTWRGNLSVLGKLENQFVFGLSRDSKDIYPNTVNFLNSTDVEVDKEISVESVIDLTNGTLIGKYYLLFTGVKGATAICPVSGDIKYRVPARIPRYSADGYWIASDPTTSSPVDRPACVIEEKTGKVLWNIGYAAQCKDARPRKLYSSVIHPARNYVIMTLGPMNRGKKEFPHSLECRDLLTGKIIWTKYFEPGLSDEPFPPVRWMIVTGEIIWTMETLLLNKEDTFTYPPKTKARLTARDIQTGEILWKKMESGYDAIVVDGKLIIITGKSMKCYSLA